LDAARLRNRLDGEKKCEGDEESCAARVHKNSVRMN
jgi:hypothetical protein